MNFAAADGETNGVPNGISGASARMIPDAREEICSATYRFSGCSKQAEACKPWIKE